RQVVTPSCPVRPVRFAPCTAEREFSAACGLSVSGSLSVGRAEFLPPVGHDPLADCRLAAGIATHELHDAVSFGRKTRKKTETAGKGDQRRATNPLYFLLTTVLRLF